MSETETEETVATETPDAAELAALRKEKADREKAERDAKDGELEALRKEKADREEADKKKVSAPVKKTAAPEKTAEKKTADAPTGKKKSRVSRTWFGDQDDD